MVSFKMQNLNKRIAVLRFDRTKMLLLAATVAMLSAAMSHPADAEETKTATTTTVQQTVTESPYLMTVPATTRTDAIMKARVGAGRSNPLATPTGLRKSTELNAAKALPKVHIPAPPKFDAHLAPPPPPTEVVPLSDGRQPLAGASMGTEAEMPEPPGKPLIAEKMKLVGVVADKAFFTFTDLELRRMNKFPSTVVLSNGEQFESVHLVSVASNKVVLEEDGERITKELERIR